MFNKKGMSPIIAAILLVVITIAIGATTFTFIRSFTDSSIASATDDMTEIECGSKVKFSFVEVGDNEAICVDTSGATDVVNLTVINTGSRVIKEMAFSFVEGQKIDRQTVLLDVATTNNQNYSITVPVGVSPEYLIIEPSIKGDNGLVSCLSAGLEREYVLIPAC